MKFYRWKKIFLHFYCLFFSNYWYSLSFPFSPPFFLRRLFRTFLFYSFFSRKFFYLSNRLNFSPLSSFTLPKSWGVLLCMIQSWDACCLSENSGNFRGLPAYFIWATRSIRRTFSLQMTNKKEISPQNSKKRLGMPKFFFFCSAFSTRLASDCTVPVYSWLVLFASVR